MSKNMFEGFDVISVYTRQQAIDDGIFVDVSGIAHKCGFIVPVALTSNLFNTHIKHEDESETNRRLNVFLLLMYRNMITNAKADDTFFSTNIKFDGEKETEVWAVIEGQSPSDPTPAINIMLPQDY